MLEETTFINMVQLRRELQASVRREISPSVAQSVQFDVNWLAGDMVAELTASVLSEKLPGKTETFVTDVLVSAPADWFQLFKSQHPRLWRGWLARRFPVRTLEVRKQVELAIDMQRWWTFPKATVWSRNLGEPVRYCQVESSWRALP